MWEKAGQWLLSKVRHSHDERMRWLLTTASTRGDIDTSHALRCACYNSRANVFDWLMANPASSVSKLGHQHLGSGDTKRSLLFVFRLHCACAKTGAFKN